MLENYVASFMFSIPVWIGLGMLGGYIFAWKGYSPKIGIVIGVIFGPFVLALCALLPMSKAGRDQRDLERLIASGVPTDQCPNCGRETPLDIDVCPRCEFNLSEPNPATRWRA